MNEWTEKDVARLLDVMASPRLQRQNVANAYNAALATEREAGVKALSERSFELHECQKQLTVAVEALKAIRANLKGNNKLDHRISIIEAALKKIGGNQCTKMDQKPISKETDYAPE